MKGINICGFGSDDDVTHICLRSTCVILSIRTFLSWDRSAVLDRMSSEIFIFIIKRIVFIFIEPAITRLLLLSFLFSLRFQSLI